MTVRGAVLAVLGLLAITPLTRAAEYNGPVVSVEDGDTFTINDGSVNRRVRLCGVDSPERGKDGYRKAKDVLAELIAGQTVRCIQVGAKTPCDGRSRPTNRDRIVAQCFVGETDIAAEMVRSGNACDWPKFSGGHYRLDSSISSGD